jgi:hypothetical protein
VREQLGRMERRLNEINDELAALDPPADRNGGVSSHRR